MQEVGTWGIREDDGLLVELAHGLGAQLAEILILKPIRVLCGMHLTYAIFITCRKKGAQSSSPS